MIAYNVYYLVNGNISYEYSKKKDFNRNESNEKSQPLI